MVDSKENILDKCLALIEDELGWGNSESWSTSDFEKLSKRIQEKTNVNLSVATLKRIWGKIRYESKPNLTTLNTLAQYLGHSDWRDFKKKYDINYDTSVHTLPSKDGHTRPHVRRVIFILVLLGAIGVASFFLLKEPAKGVDPDQFEFSSKKVVDTGVPNTVVFDYNALAASPVDSVFIQQSWDEKLSRQVKYDERKHTSIYYYPGHFDAKLVIDGEVVKEHKLLIKTNGWLPLIEQEKVPVYFKSPDAIHDGVMQLSLEKYKESNIPLQPKTPWVAYYNIREFDVMSDNMIFETELKNDYKEGAAACQHAEIRVQFEGPAIVMPITARGCVGEINFADANGSERDFSAFGSDFLDWVHVAIRMKGEVGEIFIDDKKAIKFKLMSPPSRVVGIGFRFQGTGSVNFVKLGDLEGHVAYEEHF